MLTPGLSASSVSGSSSSSAIKIAGFRVEPHQQASRGNEDQEYTATLENPYEPNKSSTNAVRLRNQKILKERNRKNALLARNEQKQVTNSSHRKEAAAGALGFDSAAIQPQIPAKLPSQDAASSSSSSGKSSMPAGVIDKATIGVPLERADADYTQKLESAHVDLKTRYFEQTLFVRQLQAHLKKNAEEKRRVEELLDTKQAFYEKEIARLQKVQEDLTDDEKLRKRRKELEKEFAKKKEELQVSYQAKVAAAQYENAFHSGGESAEPRGAMRRASLSNSSSSGGGVASQNSVASALLRHALAQVVQSTATPNGSGKNASKDNISEAAGSSGENGDTSRLPPAIASRLGSSAVVLCGAADEILSAFHDAASQFCDAPDVPEKLEGLLLESTVLMKLGKAYKEYVERMEEVLVAATTDEILSSGKAPETQAITNPASGGTGRTGQRGLLTEADDEHADMLATVWRAQNLLNRQSRPHKMFNGVGLMTARGSGTSGYVQRNLANARPRQDRFVQRGAANVVPLSKQNPELVDHAARRKIEVELLDYADELRTKGVSDERIGEEVAKLRERKMKDINRRTKQEATSRAEASTENVAQQKALEMQKFERAFGVSRDLDEGDAFLGKQERDAKIQAKREKQEQERLEKEKKREQERQQREEERQRRAEEQKKMEDEIARVQKELEEAKRKEKRRRSSSASEGRARKAGRTSSNGRTNRNSARAQSRRRSSRRERGARRDEERRSSQKPKRPETRDQRRKDSRDASHEPQRRSNERRSDRVRSSRREKDRTSRPNEQERRGSLRQQQKRRDSRSGSRRRTPERRRSSNHRERADREKQKRRSRSASAASDSSDKRENDRGEDAEKRETLKKRLLEARAKRAEVTEEVAPERNEQRAEVDRVALKERLREGRAAKIQEPEVTTNNANRRESNASYKSANSVSNSSSRNSSSESSQDARHKKREKEKREARAAADKKQQEEEEDARKKKRAEERKRELESQRIAQKDAEAARRAEKQEIERLARAKAEQEKDELEKKKTSQRRKQSRSESELSSSEERSPSRGRSRRKSSHDENVATKTDDKVGGGAGQEKERNKSSSSSARKNSSASSGSERSQEMLSSSAKKKKPPREDSRAKEHKSRSPSRRSSVRKPRDNSRRAVRSVRRSPRRSRRSDSRRRRGNRRRGRSDSRRRR